MLLLDLVATRSRRGPPSAGRYSGRRGPRAPVAARAGHATSATPQPSPGRCRGAMPCAVGDIPRLLADPWPTHDSVGRPSAVDVTPETIVSPVTIRNRLPVTACHTECWAGGAVGVQMVAGARPELREHGELVPCSVTQSGVGCGERRHTVLWAVRPWLVPAGPPSVSGAPQDQVRRSARTVPGRHQGPGRPPAAGWVSRRPAGRPAPRHRCRERPRRRRPCAARTGGWRRPRWPARHHPFGPVPPGSPRPPTRRRR